MTILPNSTVRANCERCSYRIHRPITGLCLMVVLRHEGGHVYVGRRGPKMAARKAARLARYR